MGKKKPSAARKKVARPARRSAKRDAPDLSHIAEQLRPLAVALDSLQLDPRNARRHEADVDVAALAASLARFGQRKPLVVNRRNQTIEAGNGLYQAAQSLGWTHVAVVLVDDDARTQTGFAIADNRTAELSAWDDAQLAELLAEQPFDDDLAGALLLDELLPAGADGDAAAEKPESEKLVPEQWSIIIDCTDADHQRTLYDRFEAEGLPCRLLTM